MPLEEGGTFSVAMVGMGKPQHVSSSEAGDYDRQNDMYISMACMEAFVGRREPSHPEGRKRGLDEQ